MNSSTSWIFSLSKMIQYFIHYIIWNKHKWNWGRTRNQICFYSKICDWSWSCLFKLFVFQAYGSNLWKNSTFFLTTWFLFKCQHPLPTNPTTRTINDYGILHSAAEENVLSQLGTHLLEVWTSVPRLSKQCHYENTLSQRFNHVYRKSVTALEQQIFMQTTHLFCLKEELCFKDCEILSKWRGKPYSANPAIFSAVSDMLPYNYKG